MASLSTGVINLKRRGLWIDRRPRGGGGGNLFRATDGARGPPAVVECRDESRGWHAPFLASDIFSIYIGKVSCNNLSLHTAEKTMLGTHS